jgi:hypothetical protein
MIVVIVVIDMVIVAKYMTDIWYCTAVGIINLHRHTVQD